MSALQRWLLSLATTAAAVIVSYAWLDRPIALFVHRTFPHREAFEKLTHIPDPLLPLAVVCFVAIGVRALAAYPPSRLAAAVLLCSVSVIVAEAIKNQLKFVFGRTWPDTWTHSNPSLIHDNVFGFNFFHGGEAYASFPSGHTTVTCAVISVLWIFYPRLRALWLLIALAVAVGLVGADYHFLGDVIGGGFVGVSTGWMVTLLWDRAHVFLAESDGGPSGGVSKPK
ncbi:MAG TPA: phosphatase PAP2 family protein [Pseudolabrys sp.]|nr:phosphatase PAP2 family protein [Pseudolabrys sp.]